MFDFLKSDAKIKSLEEIKNLIGEIQNILSRNARVDYEEKYRGQGLDSFKLINGLGRYNHKSANLVLKEKELFRQFLKKVNSKKIDIQKPYHADRYPYHKEWFYLFQAQHMGLKTRLLDWSWKWEIALLFAVDNEKLFGQDGQFWIFICPKKYIINPDDMPKILDTHPLEIKNSYMINSPFYQGEPGDDFIGERRRSRQMGRFFIQPFEQSRIPIDKQDEFKNYLFKLTIDGKAKQNIKRELNDNDITLNWALYRNDDNIDDLIKYLNEKIIRRCHLKP